MPAVTLEELYPHARAAWRAWLKKNHQRSSGVWLLYAKRGSGKPRVEYADAVEEALCFGWIDSVLHRIDDAMYAQKFTPRRKGRNWSALNISRVQLLAAQGRVAPAGLAAIPPGVLERPAPRREARPEPPVPRFMQEALRSNQPAWANFERLAPSYRRAYIHWLSVAKTPTTRQRRTRRPPNS